MSPSNTSTKGLNPMRFPRNDRIPVTEKELQAQGIKFCFHKILAQNRCLAIARVSNQKIVEIAPSVEKCRSHWSVVALLQDSYLTEGLDPNKGPEWYYYHLRMCFKTYTAANQCIIDHKDQELRERQKRIREKRLGSGSVL